MTSMSSKLAKFYVLVLCYSSYGCVDSYQRVYRSKPYSRGWHGPSRPSSAPESYHKLMSKLDKNYFYKQNLLMQKEHLPFLADKLNKVHDIRNYVRDQKDVNRAWSRKGMTTNQDQLNTHFVNLARQNLDNVMKTAKCELPTRRCLNVNKMDISGKNKIYWPNCALVYKCGHDSGCCKDPNHVCSPVKSNNIELYFFSLDRSNEKAGHVERLTFENHTSCDCRPMPAIDMALAGSKDCQCPRNFFSLTSESSCQCDCDDTKRKCQRVKRGSRSYPSKGCKGRKCSPPKCEYGEYKQLSRRCPKKKKDKK